MKKKWFTHKNQRLILKIKCLIFKEKNKKGTNVWVNNTNFTAYRLVPALKQLDTILTTEIFYDAVREKAGQSNDYLRPELAALADATKIQHMTYLLIQLNADSLYPSDCWSLCLLCLLILMLIMLMLILIESRSMLIEYWLGDRK